MPRTVTYHDPRLSDGHEVAVGSLDILFKNGEATEVPDEAVALYEKRTGRTFDDLLLGKKFGGPGRPKPVVEADVAEPEVTNPNFVSNPTIPGDESKDNE